MLQIQDQEDGQHYTEEQRTIQLQKKIKTECQFNQIEMFAQQSILFWNFDDYNLNLQSSLTKVKNNLTLIGETPDKTKLNVKLWMRENLFGNLRESIKHLIKEDAASYHLYCQQIPDQRFNLLQIYQLLEEEIKRELDIEQPGINSVHSNQLQSASNNKRYKEIMKERKCTMIQIQWTKYNSYVKDQPQQSYYQFFDFFIDNHAQRNSLGCNQYEIKLRNFQINTFYQIYKHFLKQKIRQFNPKIIILVLDTILERQVCQFLISKLNKFSQKMIIISSCFNEDQIYSIINGCENFGKLEQNLSQNPIESYETYKDIYQYFIKSAQEQTFYKAQLKSLLLRSKSKNDIESPKKKKKQNDEIEFQFPYIYRDSVKLLSIKGNKEEKLRNYKYFVDYQKSEIIIISLGYIHQIIFDQLNNEVLAINDIKYLVFPKETYYYYQEKLYLFYGFNEKNEWSWDIRVYNFCTKQWEIYQDSKKPDRSIQFKTKSQADEISNWYDFSVVPCFLNPGNKDQVHFTLIGGILSESFNVVDENSEVTQKSYCNLIVDLIFLDNNEYQSSVWKKEVYKNSFRESQYPLLLKQEDKQFIYFEGKPSQQLNSSPYNRALLISMKEIGKYKLICEQIVMKNQKSQQLLQKYSNFINSSSCNIQKDEKQNKYIYLINLQDKFKLDQSQVSQIGRLKKFSKTDSKIYIRLEFKFEMVNNILQLDINEEEYFTYDEQSEPNFSQDFLFSNWVDNIDDTEIYLDEELQQYILKYIHREKTEIKEKKFIFDNFESEYDESAFVNKQQQTLSVVRLYVPDKLVFYQAPFVYLQDVRDAVEDNEITAISLNQCLEVNTENNNNNILFFYQTNEFEYVIQLNNEFLIVERSSDQKTKEDKWNLKFKGQQKFNKNINLQQQLIQFYFKEQMYLFYERVQITNSECVIKYFYRDKSNTTRVSLNKYANNMILQMSIIKITVRQGNTILIMFQIEHSDGAQSYISYQFEFIENEQLEFKTEVVSKEKQNKRGTQDLEETNIHQLEQETEQIQKKRRKVQQFSQCEETKIH